MGNKFIHVDRVYRVSARELERKGKERQLQTDESLWIGLNNLHSWQAKQTRSIFFSARLIFQNFTVVFAFHIPPWLDTLKISFLQGIALNNCPTNSSMWECQWGTLESFRFVPSSNTLVAQSTDSRAGNTLNSTSFFLCVCLCFFRMLLMLCFIQHSESCMSLCVWAYMHPIAIPSKHFHIHKHCSPGLREPKKFYQVGFHVMYSYYISFTPYNIRRIEWI